MDVTTPGQRRASRRRPELPGGRDAGLLLSARVLMSGQRAFIGVVVPIYLARRGYSATELGILFSVVALAAAAMSTFIGIAADRVGRKPFLIYVPLLTAASCVVFALTAQTVPLFIAAAVGSVGRGSGAGAAQVGPYQPAEQALMAGLVDDSRRPALFGLIASASAAGGLLGSLLAATPLSSPLAGTHPSPGAYWPAFMAAALLATLAAALAVPVRQPPRAPRPGAGDKRPADPHSAQTADQPDRPPRLSPASWRLVRRLWATNTVNGVAVGLFGPFVTYWLYRRYGASAAEIGVLYTIGNVITIASSQLASPLATRIGTVRTVVIARTLQALLLPVLALMPSFALAGVVYTMRLVAQRLGVALRQSFVMSAAPAAERARVGAFAQLPTQGAAALAPMLTGYLFTEVSLALPFELAGALQLINAALFQHFFATDDRPSAGEQP
ncbi:MFS transporter [Conexibacter sp. S30A1]|uniref:MFS transporter n=1 Tax=Conexibacter sp. S30A1 TaxID=2937800 RepID=UPI00200F8E89|nr:MFS transporter [Conexibacter sp. S30A1]